jgi:plastocyanin
VHARPGHATAAGPGARYPPLRVVFVTGRAGTHRRRGAERDERTLLVRTRNLALLTLLPLALLLAACNGDAAPAQTEFDIDMVDIAYEPDRITVPAGEPVTLNFTNGGNLEHDFVLDEQGIDTDNLQPGETLTVQLDPLSESVVAYCSVPGHREAGMELEIVVE